MADKAQPVKPLVVVVQPVKLLAGMAQPVKPLHREVPEVPFAAIAMGAGAEPRSEDKYVPEVTLRRTHDDYGRDHSTNEPWSAGARFPRVKPPLGADL